MNNRALVILAVLFSQFWAFNPAMSADTESSASADTDKCFVKPSDIDKACITRGWCIQAENFAFRILPKEDMSVQFLQYLQTTPGSPNLEFVIKQVMENPNTRTFSCSIRPLPAVHAINFKWNIGLVLKSGDRVWATSWIYLTNGIFSAHEPFGLQFVPGVQGMSDSGCSFELFCVFPNQTESGKEWRNGQVSGLVIE
ncbi:MAG: hypothetical protein WC734_02660 [Patescibacteria group bacterium]|jgi:hypothetical protein